MDIPIHTASCSELIKLSGCAIRVTLITKKHVFGNLYTVDPESKSVVLVDAQNGRPENFKLIPGDSISKIELVSDDDSCAAQYFIKQSDGLNALFTHLFKPHAEKEIDTETIDARKTIIEEIFQKGRVRYEFDDEKNIIVGAVKIKYPYTRESCISTNNVALSRILKLVEIAFK